MTTSTRTIANSRVASSHLVCTMYLNPSRMSIAALINGCRSLVRSRRTAVVRISSRVVAAPSWDDGDDQERDAGGPDRDDHTGQGRTRRPA